MSEEITWYDKDGTTFWSCGCETSAGIEKGEKALIHKSCGNEVCPVLLSLNKENNKRGNKIIHRRG